MATIVGLQKMTLLDYPGKVACTVFLGGCNFRCPFCHNGELVGAEVPPAMDEEELLTFLKKRRSLLDGVCITGGEPTLQRNLAALIRKIRELGYSVKLDTNGYRPDVLRALMEEHLVDYVAMDIKNSPDRYGETTGLDRVDMDKIEESIMILTGGDVDYEFRTTVVEEFHDAASIEQMGRWLKSLAGEAGVKALYLQPYVDRDTVLRKGLHTPDMDKIRGFLDVLHPYIGFTALRGAE